MVENLSEEARKNSQKAVQGQPQRSGTSAPSVLENRAHRGLGATTEKTRLPRMSLEFSLFPNQSGRGSKRKITGKSHIRRTRQ